MLLLLYTYQPQHVHKQMPVFISRPLKGTQSCNTSSLDASVKKGCAPAGGSEMRLPTPGISLRRFCSHWLLDLLFPPDESAQMGFLICMRGHVSGLSVPVFMSYPEKHPLPVKWAPSQSQYRMGCHRRCLTPRAVGSPPFWLEAVFDFLHICVAWLNDIGGAGLQASPAAWNDRGNLKPQTRKSAAQLSHWGEGLCRGIFSDGWDLTPATVQAVYEDRGRVGKQTQLTGLLCGVRGKGWNPRACTSQGQVLNTGSSLMSDLQQFIWPLWALVSSS